MEPAQQQIEKFTSITEALFEALKTKLTNWLETLFSMLPNIVVAFMILR